MSIPGDAWPKGDRTEWWEDSTRTHHDFFNGSTRPYTAAENAEADKRKAAATAEANRTALTTMATNALANNREFLALTTVTNAAVVAQTRALTRQVNALIRLTVGALDDTDEAPAPRPRPTGRAD